MLCKDEERKMQRMKEDVVDLYEREISRPASQQEMFRSCQLKLSKSERTMIKSLSSTPGIVIKPSDKSKGFVVMSESQYVEKVSKLLGEKKDYERVTEITTRLDDATRHFVESNIADKLPEKLEGAVKPHHSRMPQFYGLPKDHKPGMPVRPVVSACGRSTSNMSLSWSVSSISCSRLYMLICRVRRSVLVC